MNTQTAMTDRKAFGLISARIKRLNKNLEYRKNQGMSVDYGERDSLLWLLDKIRQFSLRFLKGEPMDIELRIRDLEARIENLTTENRQLTARLNKKNKISRKLMNTQEKKMNRPEDFQKLWREIQREKKMNRPLEMFLDFITNPRFLWVCWWAIMIGLCIVRFKMG